MYVTADNLCDWRPNRPWTRNKNYSPGQSSSEKFSAVSCFSYALPGPKLFDTDDITRHIAMFYLEIIKRFTKVRPDITATLNRHSSRRISSKFSRSRATCSVNLFTKRTTVRNVLLKMCCKLFSPISNRVYVNIVHVILYIVHWHIQELSTPVFWDNKI